MPILVIPYPCQRHRADGVSLFFLEDLKMATFMLYVPSLLMLCYLVAAWYMGNLQMKLIHKQTEKMREENRQG